MKTVSLLFLACALVGCQSSPRQGRWIPPQFDAPRAGQIQVAVSGNVKAPGTRWMVEPATLANIQTFTREPGPNPAPLKVMITRMENGHANNTVLVLTKMNLNEKEAVPLKHGDFVQVYEQEPPVFPH